MPSPQDLQTRKQTARAVAFARRQLQTNKEEISERIVYSLLKLPEYLAAEGVLWYMDVRDEVRTRSGIIEGLASSKKIVVPYCVEGELELFWLERLDELEPASYGILEPRKDLRHQEVKRISPGELDLVIAPGVAFDRSGVRLGHGKGYYDRMLQRIRGNTPIIGLAYECQIFDEIPHEKHDISMDRVVTEETVYNGKGRK